MLKCLGVMICIMNLVMANSYLLPFLLTTITIYIILLIFKMTSILFILSEGVGCRWEIFKVTRGTQEAEMTIGKCTKFRDKSQKLPKSNTRKNSIMNRSSYCPRYHTGKIRGRKQELGARQTR